jgi:poly(A) polymerase
VIMQTFGLYPCKIVGDIKNAIKDAMLDGIIPNEYDAAFAYMLKLGSEMNLAPVKE